MHHSVTLRRMVLVAAAVAVVAVWPLGAWAAYNVGPVNSQDTTPVPDVDKAGVGGVGPAVNDNGCWAVTASDLLGAAGWGIPGTAQQKGDQIYADLISAFKTFPADTYLTAGGDMCPAALWWVNNVGLNPAAAGYSPSDTYVNFRTVQKTLHESDYNLLLNELNGGKYVGVFWITGGSLGHNMTLVAGNYGPHHPLPAVQQVSVWHNSDSDFGGNDEVYGHDWDNNADPMWYLNMNGIIGDHNTVVAGNKDWFADGYFTAGAGAPKPVSAIGNFDVHYYIGPKTPPAGNPLAYSTEDQMLTTGGKLNQYTGPGGEFAGHWKVGAPSPTLVVPGQQDANQGNSIYVMVDFNDPSLVPIVAGLPVAPAIIVNDDLGNAATLVNADTAWASDNGQVLLHFTFQSQPLYEEIVFPGTEYKNLLSLVGDNVLDWDIAVTPEPATLMLLGIGLAAVVARRRRT